MNIGLVTVWFPSGGGNVSKSFELALHGTHRVFVYARGGARSSDARWAGGNVTRAPSHPVSSGIHARHFTRWARRHRLDAVLFNEQHQWAGVVLAKRLGLLTGAYVDYYTQDTVPFFDLYDFLVCNTKRHFGVFDRHPQGCYCPWGTDTGLYRPAERREPGPLRFLISAGWDGHYSRHAPYMDRRGAGPAMRAFRRVRGNSRLIVLSQDPLERCPAEWAALIREDSRIDFRHGTFDPTPYGIGDVYLYPSRLDGIGLTLPEALSSGLPAITTDSPPMNEFVRDGVNGLVVKVREHRGRPDGYYWAQSLCDEEDLVRACQFYVDNPGSAREQGARARSLAEQELNWSKNAAFLPGWIATRRPLATPEDGAWRALAERAVRYDNDHHPTPWRRMRRGAGLLLKQVLGRAR